MIPDYPVKQEWPPAREKDAQRFYRESQAWYSGDPEALQRVYQSGEQGGLVAATPFAKTGVRGMLQRFWWGKGLTPEQSTTHLHVPIAADLATFSADLLYADLPAFRIPAASKDGKLSTAEAKVQSALDKIVDESGISITLPASAELGSAFGGRYIGTRVDVRVSPDSPMFFYVAPEHAVPEFVYGRLVAVTFWRVVSGPDKQVYRHLERHEVDASRRAMIYHALYMGTEEKLGIRVDLTTSDELLDIAAKVDPDGGIWAGCSVLDVQYIPNMLPHRLMPGSALGRSDTQGNEPIMDALDEAMSSWQRDIRNGKGRVLMPGEYMRSWGQGRGAEFDMEQEVFKKITVMAGDQTYVKPEVVQFMIRVEEHERTCAQHLRTIVRGAGLSAGAFGEEVDGGKATAREVGERKTRTMATRGKKINNETFALRMLLFAALEQAKNLIGGPEYSGIEPKRPNVEFSDAAAPDPQAFATTLKMLADARLISTQTGVEMLHPEWDDEQVRAEVERIEKPQANPDQFDGGFGGGDAGGGEGDEEGAEPAEDTEPQGR